MIAVRLFVSVVIVGIVARSAVGARLRGEPTEFGSLGRRDQESGSSGEGAVSAPGGAEHEPVLIGRRAGGLRSSRSGPTTSPATATCATAGGFGGRDSAWPTLAASMSGVACAGVWRVGSASASVWAQSISGFGELPGG